MDLNMYSVCIYVRRLHMHVCTPAEFTACRSENSRQSVFIIERELYTYTGLTEEATRACHRQRRDKHYQNLDANLQFTCQKRHVKLPLQCQC